VSAATVFRQAPGAGTEYQVLSTGYSVPGISDPKVQLGYGESSVFETAHLFNLLHRAQHAFPLGIGEASVLELLGE
jgi:hypothetical protein